METSLLIKIGISLAIIGYLVYEWVAVYNKFVYWKNRAERKFADIDVVMQQRIDLIPTLAQIAKKYSIHEWKTLKETIEARSRWSKDTPFDEKVKAAQQFENNFLKIQTVFERYPKVRADKLFQQIMGSGSISKVERKLREFRLGYNRVAQEYNERVQRFPRNIVAKVHGFKILDYLTLGNQVNQGPQEKFNLKEIFKD